MLPLSHDQNDLAEGTGFHDGFMGEWGICEGHLAPHDGIQRSVGETRTKGGVD